jgi:benzoyl-CoA reductase/2-hydroxyglutaryl-CoA dehydratase subunit BcrC/BadD/HgdB
VHQPHVVASWPAVPVEIVRATGFRPLIARGASGPTPAADVHLERGIFPNRVRQLVENALTGRLADAARIVIPRTSDADYKCFLYLREFVRTGVTTALAPVVLFDMLQSHGPAVRAYDVSRVHALLDDLSSASGRRPSADDLRREITRANTARAAARRLVSFRRSVPRVSGTEVVPLLAAFWEMDPDRYAETVSDAASRIAVRPPLAGPRVLLAGAPVDGNTLHEAIESHGAVVVDEAGPWGNGAAGDDVRIDDDPVAALADKYRAESIGARTPVDALRRLTARMLDGVDAVVASLPPEDAVFGWDYPALRDVLHARRIPHVCLRCDPYGTPTSADRAALDAMVSAASRMQEARDHG